MPAQRFTILNWPEGKHSTERKWTRFDMEHDVWQWGLEIVYVMPIDEGLEVMLIGTKNSLKHFGKSNENSKDWIDFLKAM